MNFQRRNRRPWQVSAASRSTATDTPNIAQRPTSPFSVRCRYCGSEPYYKCVNKLTGQAIRKQAWHPCRALNAWRPRRHLEVIR